MGSFILKVVAVIGELLIKFGLKKREQTAVQKADALGKTVESVGKSLDVEKGIRDKQDEIDKHPSDVESSDGGLDFDDFNSGK